MKPMTEADENNLRVLMARLRDERPEDFAAMFVDVMLFRMEDNSLRALRHVDGDEIPDAAVVIFKGVRPASWALKSIEEMKKIADGVNGADDKDAG